MSFDIAVDVECRECGASLSGYFKHNRLTIDPCESCINTAKEVGYEEGREDIDNEIENIRAEYEDLLENKSDRITELEEELFRLQGDN